jgi:hypothetical protein
VPIGYLRKLSASLGVIVERWASEAVQILTLRAVSHCVPESDLVSVLKCGAKADTCAPSPKIWHDSEAELA